ncbi:MAG TPA: glycosyltransferase family 2 protein [Candidatus Paceibacterota bacterium]
MSSLVIIGICAHNEEKDLAQTVADIREAMSRTEYTYGVLIQNDGSTDRTHEIGRRCADFVYAEGERAGLARTFKANMRNCLMHGADIVVHTDGDGQYPAEKIPELIRQIEAGYDLAIGSRFLGGDRYANGVHKRFGNKIFSAVMSLVCGRRVTDVTSGFRAMSRATAELIDIQSQFTYTYDQYVQASWSGLRIAEIPIAGSPTRTSRLMKSFMHYTTRALRDIAVNWKTWRVNARILRTRRAAARALGSIPSPLVSDRQTAKIGKAGVV